MAVSRKAWANTYDTFTGLLPPSAQQLKIMMQAELLNFIEEVYTAHHKKAVGVWQQKQKLPSDLTSFPQSVLTVARTRYGLRRMVDQESYDSVDALFYVKMRCAARKMTMPWKYNQVSKMSLRAGARPQLPLNKALAAVREGIDKEAPDSLKASIFARLKHRSGDGADPIDWDRFLFLCTQEYGNARCIAAGSSAIIMTTAASQTRVTASAQQPSVTGATTLLQQRGRLQSIKMTQPQTELKEQAFRQAGTPTTASSPEKASDAGSTTPLSFDEFLGFTQSQSGQEENSSRDHRVARSRPSGKVWPPSSVEAIMQREKMEDEKIKKQAEGPYLARALTLEHERIASEWAKWEGKGEGCFAWLWTLLRPAFPRPGPQRASHVACGVLNRMEEIMEAESEWEWVNPSASTSSRTPLLVEYNKCLLLLLRHASNGVKLLPRDVCGALPAKSETHPAGLEGFMASLHMDMSTEGENCISIRIRSPKAIGERLAEEAPADARGEAKAEKPPRAPLLIKSFDSLSSAKDRGDVTAWATPFQSFAYLEDHLDPATTTMARTATTKVANGDHDDHRRHQHHNKVSELMSCAPWWRAGKAEEQEATDWADSRRGFGRNP
eukprot:s391_g7.t2